MKPKPSTICSSWTRSDFFLVLTVINLKKNESREVRDFPLPQPVISEQPLYHHQLADSQIVWRPDSPMSLLFFFIISNVPFWFVSVFLIPLLYQYSLSIILESLSFSVSSPTLLYPPPHIFAFSILPHLFCTTLFILSFLCSVILSPLLPCCPPFLLCLSPFQSFIASLPTFVSSLSFSFCAFVTCWVPKVSLLWDCSS